MKGWFDAFREEGGPTLYAYHNRTAVAADVPALALLVAALTLYIAFLAVFPGIRKEVVLSIIFYLIKTNVIKSRVSIIIVNLL